MTSLRTSAWEASIVLDIEKFCYYFKIFVHLLTQFWDQWFFNWITCIHIGCLPFAQKFCKFRMECKWKDEFCLPEQKFSGENRIS